MRHGQALHIEVRGDAVGRRYEVLSGNVNADFRVLLRIFLGEVQGRSSSVGEGLFACQHCDGPLLSEISVPMEEWEY